MFIRLCGWAVVVFVGFGSSVAAAQGTAADHVFARLDRGRYLDSYCRGMTAEVASNLIKATDRWSGVQVNRPPRAGEIGIYLVDADRLPSNNVLRAEGIELGRESLHRNAITHEASSTIFIDTGMLKEIAASTFLTQTRAVASITAAVAKVQAEGLSTLRPAWEEATRDPAEPERERIDFVMRGALAFIVAHEMGHVAVGRTEIKRGSSSFRVLTPRQYDEVRACPELLDKEYLQRQQVERRVDAFAAGLLARQCTIGKDGGLRYEAYVLGAIWYFLFTTSTRLLAGARATDSPFIRQNLTKLIGPDLYTAVVEKAAHEQRGGAVHALLPPSHPPDLARSEQLETDLNAPPCGRSGPPDKQVGLFHKVLAEHCKSFQAKEKLP